MSLIIDAVKATIPQECYAMPLEMVGTFAFLTTVKTRQLGICMTLSDDRVFPWHSNNCVRGLGEVHKMNLKDILTWTDSQQGIERSFAMAALNSALPYNQKEFSCGNALKLVEKLGRNKKVAVVGHFPGMDMIRNVAAKFSIIEKRPQEGDLTAEDAVKVIPESDVVAITGVTCLNDTIEGLLALKKRGATVVMVGPSVPLSPALFDFGVDVIGGMHVVDAEQAYICASQGGAPRHLRGVKYALLAKNQKLLSDID